MSLELSSALYLMEKPKPSFLIKPYTKRQDPCKD
jgi:hypothetical protein